MYLFLCFIARNRRNLIQIYIEIKPPVFANQQIYLLLLTTEATQHTIFCVLLALICSSILRIISGENNQLKIPHWNFLNLKLTIRKKVFSNYCKDKT